MENYSFSMDVNYSDNWIFFDQSFENWVSYGSVYQDDITYGSSVWASFDKSSFDGSGYSLWYSF